PGELSGVRFDRKLEAGEQAPFVLEVPYGVLRGVVYSSTGEPASGLTVQLQATDVEESENGPRIFDPEDTDENGEFEFIGLLDGVYRLATVPERYGWWSNRDESEPVDAPATLEGVRVNSEKSGPTTVEVRQEEGGTVTGIVTRSNGTSAAGLIVYLADEDGEMVWGSVTQVGRNGTYELKGLPQGKQTLGVRDRRSDKRVTEKVSVVLGQETVLDFTFD
ncbi:MAG: carboxypeptidase-like regulatory domain-containing protein, partial [Planctomycetota bacterium]